MPTATRRITCLASVRIVGSPRIRHTAAAPQLLELATLLVDVALHVSRDRLEARVTVQGQPHGVVSKRVPPEPVIPGAEIFRQGVESLVSTSIQHESFSATPAHGARVFRAISEDP